MRGQAGRDRWRLVAYGAVEVVLAPLWLALGLLGVLGVVLSVVWVGVPLVLAALAGVRGLGVLERALARRMVAVDVVAPAGMRQVVGVRARLAALTASPDTWRGLGYALVRAVVALLAAPLVAMGLFAAGLLLALPVADGVVVSGGWTSQAGLASWWAVPLALAMLAATAAVLGAVGLACRAALALLGSSPVRTLTSQLVDTRSRADLAAALHDGLGHAVTLMVLQAGAARRRLPADPDGAGVAMRLVEQEGRRVLDGLDAVLDAVGGDRAGALSDLAASAALAGQPVAVAVDLDVAALDDVAWDVVQAVVREGLTNALRHARGAPTEVRVAPDGRGCAVTVTNDGAGAATGLSGGGRGLVGLRRRVRQAGGVLEAGPTTEGGWLLSARLPGVR